MARERDVSGLFEGASTPPEDRSPGIAPPPRRTTTTSPPAQPAPQDTPTIAAVPALAAEPTPPPVPAASAATETVKTALSLTQAQAAWLSKQAAKRDMWLGELVTELIHTHSDTARTTPVERVRRQRNGSNYTQIQIYLAQPDRDALDKLVAETGRSMAATGRILIDAAISSV